MATKAKTNEAASAGASGQALQRFIDNREVGRRVGLALRTVDDWVRRGVVAVTKAQVMISG